MKEINASEFKTKCLALFDEIARTGEGMTVLKHGRPVAQILPALPRDQGYPQETLKGSVEICGDVISPVLPAESWETESGMG